MKKVLIVLLLAGGVGAIAYASFNNNSRHKQKTEKQEMKKEECKKNCPFS